MKFSHISMLCGTLLAAPTSVDSFAGKGRAFVGRQGTKTQQQQEDTPTCLAASIAKGEAMMPLSTIAHRQGRWLPKKPKVIGAFLNRLRKKARENPELVTEVAELDNFVRADAALYSQAENMFSEAIEELPNLPDLGTTPVENWGEFISLLNIIVRGISPEFYVDDEGEHLGLIGFPINALLDWPMASQSGQAVFSDKEFNKKLMAVLNLWKDFLETNTDSNYCLTDDGSDIAPYVAWLSDDVKKELVSVVTEAKNNPRNMPSDFTSIFNCPEPEAADCGYKTWDEFFIREFDWDLRPVAKDTRRNFVLANACESAPLRVYPNVKYEDKFWLKDQPYSLKQMMNGHPDTDKYEGGTVYQAFLSAMSYHRWHSPISGEITHVEAIPGTYYLQNPYYGFYDGTPDPVGPNDSQPFLSQVATRSIIHIKSPIPDIGTVVFIAMGMAEVSSCEVVRSNGEPLEVGQTIEKGEQIGTFHFGGSTHCLIFEKGVNIDFDGLGQEPNINAVNIAVRSKIGTFKPRDKSLQP